MSSMSLEERRAERRRKRQMEEEASSVATVNGEDDLERRRRERREQRLRASGDTDYTSTDDYSSRRNRHRGSDDTTEDTPTVNEVPVSSVPDTSEEDAAEERRRRQREEEEEEARRQAEREAEEERQRQAALEEERRREQEARRLAEEERQRQEEEEERRRNDEAEIESGSVGSSEEDSYKQNNTENKLFIEEDDCVAKDVPVDKLERVRQWNEESNNVDNVERRNSDNLWNKNLRESHEASEKSRSVDRSGSFKEINNNNKIKDKLNKFEHLKDESDTKIVRDKTVLIPFVDKNGLKGKLQKFEKEIKDQEVPVKETNRQPSYTAKSVILTPKPHRLTAKLQQFEIAAKSQSASKPSSTDVQKTESKDTPKRNVLDRWKSVDKHHQDSPSLTSPSDRKEVLNKRLSGNTEYIVSKYIEKASKSIDETSPAKTPVPSTQRNSFTQSFDQRKTSQSSEAQSDISEDITNNQSRTKVTSRWQFDGAQSDVSEEMPVKQSRGKVTNRWPFKEGGEDITSTPNCRQSVNPVREIHSRESSSDYTQSHSAGSSIDGLSENSRRSSNQLQQEEEEEEERLRQEKEARMGAEDGQKKRGKRKGLGGLTPEKKKKLKQIIMQKASEDLKKEALAKAQEKEKFINDRVGPLNAEGLGEAELRKLIKGLHEKLAQIHSEAYDIELKLFKQEKEIVDLNMKISDSRGKFAKPVLRKVNKTEQKFAKMSKKTEHKDDFRETLKSAHDDDEGAE